MKEIKDYPGYFAYEDSRIWSSPKGTSNPRGKFLKHSLHHSGYKVVSVVQNGVKKSCFVHRLIALAYIDNPQALPTINHKNGIKTDNSISNLEWATMEDNVKHAEKFGLRKHNDWGENNSRAKLTNKQAEIIKQLALEGNNQKKIAKMFDISQPLVSLIKLGKNYAKI